MFGTEVGKKWDNVPWKGRGRVEGLTKRAGVQGRKEGDDDEEEG